MGFIKNYSELAINDDRKIILDLVESALSSIQPQTVMSENFTLDNSKLKISDKNYDLNTYENVYLIAFGKGSAGIAKIIETTLGDKLTKGFCIDTNEESFQKIEFVKGSHPLPSVENLDFTKKVVSESESFNEKDLVLVVICGGGSVLFEQPHSVTLDQLIEVNKELLKSGADIYEMNTIRKHLSKTKGGGLADIIHPAKVVSLIFSDVPGNDLSFIASGPTILDKTTKEDALNVYKKYNLNKLTENDFSDTPKDQNIFSNVDNILMLSNLTALNAMKQNAESKNIKTEIYSEKFESDASLAAKILIDKTEPNSILLIGGETTVKVKNPNGKGGRNQVVTLSSLSHIDDKTIVCSFDSDGFDNSPVAGAIGDSETIRKAKELNLDSQEYLNTDNSLEFFQKTGDAISTDRLPSNVSDLIIIYKTS